MQSVTTKVKPIPAGYHSVTPYLIVEGAPKLIAFLKQTFNAEEVARMNGPDGRVAHAEVKIGDSIVMMSDSTAEFKPAESQLYVYVDDIDVAYKRALDAGAISVREPKNQFYGDRSASVKDPTGNTWGIATHVEDVSPEEMQKRMKEQSLGQ
ncbi:MAG TPA: VOC family protein [Candidatus Bathyarchaeia archaeon]|nr:VOC family protein [Candidatus Bathyarchaeia archaeon]